MNKNYDFIFNILLLGDTSSGKTSLLNRYLKNIFLKDPLVTVGIDYSETCLKFDKYQIRLRILDTIGSEKYRAFAKKFYREADGFVFIFSIRYKRTLEELDYIINDVKNEKNNDYDSIICANCCDLDVQGEITKEDIKYYELKYNIKIFETSALTGFNINTAFNYLVYQILNRKSNEEVISSFKKWNNIQFDNLKNLNNIQIDNFKISLFKEPNCENIFKKRYYYNINGKYIQLNIIDNNYYLNNNGLIFYFDIGHKDSFEYIFNKINTIDEYYLNKNRTIIIYKTIKDKEDILIKKELDNLCNNKEINIFKVLNKSDIKEAIEKLIIKINDDLERTITRINNKLNKYINF